MLAPLLLFALQTVSVSVDIPSDSLVLRPDSADLATAYASDDARDLVRRARERREMVDASVFRYHALVRQRFSVGIRAFRRDRLLYSREAAASVDWRRDGPTRVELLGAREASPVVMAGVTLPEDLESVALDLVPEPGEDRLPVSPEGGPLAWHPLVEGGEALYTYAVGDSTEIRLPDGRRIRLAELRVTAREADIRAITGSFWIELQDYGIVRAVFRPSREFDLERDLPRLDPGDEDDLEDVPSVLKPIRFDLRYITIEYGLWEMRWWMPRLVAVEGYLEAGAATFPLRYEMTYSDYRVEADPHGLPSLPPVFRDLAGDSTVRRRLYEHATIVTIRDSTALLVSDALPPSAYDVDASLITEAELEELGRRIGALPAPDWAPERPRLSWPWQLGRGLLRYNRVEGLSAGARVDWALGPAALDLTARMGTGGEPVAELGLDVPTRRGTWRLEGYHRLEAANPALRPLGIGNSINALLFGRDDGMYFRASGAGIVRTPAPGERRYALRLYAERQAAVTTTTDFSVRGALDDDWRFRPNLAADPATQVGVAAGAGVDRWLDPRAFRWAAWLDVTAEVGDYDFVRPGLTLRAGAPLPGAWLIAAEVAAGTTFPAHHGEGPVSPRQSLWYLGGPASVRGFRGGAAAGEDHVRVRAEVASAFPAVRVALFGDAGWAGDAGAFAAEDALAAVGAGASFLDGLVRFDVARTLQPDRHWRVDLYVDALF